MNKFRYILNLLVAALLFLTAAIARDGKVVGIPASELLQEGETTQVETEPLPVEETLPDGTRLIHSENLAKGIFGYGGKVPVTLYLKEDVVERVELGANSETPSFLDGVLKSGLLERWQGLSLAEATQLKVDAVSGATLSSEAIIANVQQALHYAADTPQPTAATKTPFTLKGIVGIAVILLGILLAFLKPKQRWIRTLQLLLNVVVLGFWCGSFISLSLITNWLANGVNLTVALLPILLLAVAVVMPLFGKRSYYCSYACPLGSMQELLGKASPFKLNISVKVQKLLSHLRELLLTLILLTLWVGVGAELVDYELFSAFLLTQASPVVLGATLLFLVLSCFVNRPYCRFVCPTGALLKLNEQTK